MTDHDLSVAPDDCPHCADGPPSATREHFHLCAVAAAAANDTPLADYERSYAASYRPQQLPAASHAPQAPKATIDARAIYAARARAAAGDEISHHSEHVGRDAAKQPAALPAADSIYARRRADLERK